MRTSSLGIAVSAALALSVLSATHVRAETRGVTDTEIVIGSHSDLSGPAAPFGLANVRAMQMRIDEINQAGGIQGRKIRLIVEDAQYQVPRAVQAANKLVNRDNIFLMVSGLGTSQTNATMPMLEKNNVPNLFPMSQARSMWAPLDKLKFQFNADYRDQATGATQYMLETKKKSKFCAEYMDNDLGKDVVSAAEARLKLAGLSLIAKSTHKPTDTDLGTQMINLRKAGCDVIILGTLGRDAIIAYTTARRAGWTDVDFVGISPTFDSSVSSVPDGATDGLYAATGIWIKPREEMPKAGREMFDKYKAAYGIDPTVSAMDGYISIDLIGVALEKAGRDLTTDGFLHALESVKDYHDIYGDPPQSYGPDKHQGSNETFVARVKSGGFELVLGPLKPTE